MEPVCPACKAPMLPAHVGAAEVTACPKCLGAWFDSRQLALQVGRAPVEVDGLRRFAPIAPGGRATGKACPGCGSEMREFEFLWARGVRVDSCASCRGVWFERGELEAVRRISTNRPAPAGPSPEPWADPLPAAPSRVAPAPGGEAPPARVGSGLWDHDSHGLEVVGFIAAALFDVASGS